MTESSAGQPPRGFSNPSMRRAECKDCLREIREGKREPGSQWFLYPESWATGQIDRGGSRSDRCREHRQKHQRNVAGMAIAYIDLATVGEVLDRNAPTGPLGGLGPLPDSHSPGGGDPVDLGKFGFGMDETHIRRMLDSLSQPDQRVLIVKAGTGTGKSTYMPYRLLDPPQGCYRLIDNGPIVVTEPRVQATVGVAEFVGSVMSGAGGVGPGYPVGYQAGGDQQHDPACQLVFVTDGTMINWLREGRLSQIGTVIVDEAHERSTNIDFILGYLKRELPRYPHLRVIVTSATFNADFYQQYFGGEAVAGKIEVPAVKTIGYGWPLFPDLDVMLPDEAQLADQWKELLPQLQLRDAVDEDKLLDEAWPRYAPPLKEEEVRDPRDVGHVEDLHDTTRKILPLRFKEPIPVAQWKSRMPEILGRFVVQLAKGLDKAGIYGDILGFLPTGKNIEEACDIIRAGVGDRADVFALLSSLPAEDKRDALEARRKGDRRKIVVSTNLAETSLTVEGVRFVVDSGLIAQSEWDPSVAQGGIRTKPHSQAGIRQRWGRVGRKSPGWVFPLYTKGQLIELSEDTDPGSTRDNLEQLIMTAKLGGIDDVVNFDWPAAFLPEPPVLLDETAQEAREKFIIELARADNALKQGGAVDDEGHPTSFGKELSRFSALGSASCAVAIMYADRLGCVPEVATLLALMHERPLAGPNSLLLDRPGWPDEWRYEAATRHRALRGACEDDAELVLQLCAGWERADSQAPPWEPSELRRRWAQKWWVNDDVLREAAEARREILASLSPAMKEEVKRFVEPPLLRRARGAISRAMASLEYRRSEDGTYRCVGEPDTEDGGASFEAFAGTFSTPERLLPLSRRADPVAKQQRLSNILAFEPWALDGTGADVRPTGHADAMRLLVLSAEHARADTSKDVLGAVIESWPAGQRMRITTESRHGQLRVSDVQVVIEPFSAPIDAEELDAIAAVVAEDEEGADAAIEDAFPELDASWPSSNPQQPDLDALARRALLDSRDVEAAEEACGMCAPCMSGLPEACADRHEDVTEGVVDVLESWSHRATAGIDVTSPLVDLPVGADTDAWYEVVGYRIDASGEPAVVLAIDWRPWGLEHVPAQHADLVAGDHVELVVGEEVEDHRGRLRILWRADRGGRFLLREAHSSPQKQEEYHQLAISLNRGSQGLLDRLHVGAHVVGTVIPRKQPSCVTVTFLELLHQHFDRGNAGVSKKFEVQLRDGRPREVPFYPAVVRSEPNRAGYIDAELLVRDSSVGIAHASSFTAAEGVEPPDPGEPIWLRLAPESAKLSLRDIDLAVVRAIATSESSLRLVEGEMDDLEDAPVEVGERGEVGGDDPVTAGVDDKGGLDSVLISTRAVPHHVARALLPASDEAEWPYKVWRFWAQSRHIRTDSRDAYRPGEQAAPIEVGAELRAELPPAPQLSLDEAKELYPVGTKVDAVVNNVSPDGHRAWLTLVDGTGATVTKGAIGASGVTTLEGVLIPGATIEALVADVRQHNDQTQIALDLRDFPVPEDRADTSRRTDLLIADEAESVVRIYRRRLESDLNVVLTVGREPLTLHVQADNDESLAAAVPTLERYVASTSAVIDVPPDKKGAVLGRGAERIKQLQAMDGVLHCNFGRDDDEYRLLVAAESSSQLTPVVAQINDLINRQPDHQQRMWVPAGKNGLLIGTGGRTIKELLARSGCSSARAIDNGSEWAVKGPTREHIAEFVRLAATVVPGCTVVE